MSCQTARRAAPRCARRTAIAISVTFSPMARATAADCAIASTRPRCGSFTATTWRPRVTRRTWTRWTTMAEERAVLAGGCFWGVQDLLRRHDGVLSTRVGYTGGSIPNATYRNHGYHAEAVEIIFDPARISYRQLLELF